jgi:hypothetical protein
LNSVTEFTVTAQEITLGKEASVPTVNTEAVCCCCPPPDEPPEDPAPQPATNASGKTKNNARSCFNPRISLSFNLGKG